MQAPVPLAASDPRYREMVERCQNGSRRKTGIIGSLLGGVIGSVAGNRIASGNRTIGTIVGGVAGGAIGAIAGTAIDRTADRNRARECDEFFAAYAPQPNAGYGYPAGYPAAYPGYGYMMVPVMMVPMPQQQQQPCTETRTETVTYVPVRGHHHHVTRRPAYHVKRVKEKRVYTGS